jgi:hypothetical protein
MARRDKSTSATYLLHWTSAGPDAARWEQAFSADGGKTWETNWIMDFTRSGHTTTAGGNTARTARDNQCCALVELRQYVLHTGQRETLIDLFEREFVESQEAAGMQVIGQFRDVDRPDNFTWLRGFADMPSRAASLAAFYDGPVWARNRDAANRTMVSSDDVRLLRAALPGSGFTLGDRAGGDSAIPRGLVIATIYTIAPAAAADFADFFARTIAPRLADSGASPIAMFETEPSANNFPRLTVREGEHAFVWFAHFNDAAAYERHLTSLASDRRWTSGIRAGLERQLVAPVEVLRLTPTARSRALR